MFYMSVPAAPSSERHLLSEVAPTLSLKKYAILFLPSALRALEPQHARLQFPPSPLCLSIFKGWGHLDDVPIP